MRDLLHMINKTDETGIPVTLDQEKAFDRVDHEFSMCTLAKLGFGPRFCQWVSLFYNNVFFRIICNGNLTVPVFQAEGCDRVVPSPPLSMSSCPKCYRHRSVIVLKLLVFASLVLADNILKFPSMLTMLGISLKLSALFSTFFGWCILTRGGLGPSSTLRSPKRCGLAAGEPMAPPPMALSGSAK